MRISILLALTFFSLDCVLSQSNADDTITVPVQEEEQSFVFRKPSKSFRIIMDKIWEANLDFQSYITKDYVLSKLSFGRLIMSSNDAILYSKEIEYRKLLFTNYYFDKDGFLDEVKYFFYDDFPSLRLECLTQKEELRRKIGEPILSGKEDHKLYYTWHYKNKVINLSFTRDKVSKEGMVHLSISGQEQSEEELQVQLSPTSSPKLDNNNTANSIFVKKTKIEPDWLERNNYYLKKSIREKLESLTSVQKTQTKYTVTPTPNQSYTISKSTSLRAEANSASLIITRLKTGNSFIFLESIDAYWSKVIYNDMEGFVKTALIENL